MRKRGDVGSKAKALAALEALKGHEPIGAIAKRFKVHPIQVGKWRKRLLEDMYQVFEDGGTADAAAHEREVQELYEQIGRLKVENDFLKKKSGLGS
jgi:transposase